MKDDLVRFGVAMEPSLLEGLDELAAARGCNRSEVLRDLARAELSRSSPRERVPAFAAVTLVYNHHIRELSARLTELQHGLGEQVRSSMHVHLDHDHCLEVIVMRGRADQLKDIADRMIGTRGVLQGGAEYVAESTLGAGGSQAHDRRRQEQSEGHAHPHPHPHDHHAPPERARKAPKPIKRARAAR